MGKHSKTSSGAGAGAGGRPSAAAAKPGKTGKPKHMTPLQRTRLIEWVKADLKANRMVVVKQNKCFSVVPKKQARRKGLDVISDIAINYNALCDAVSYVLDDSDKPKSKPKPAKKAAPKPKPKPEKKAAPVVNSSDSSDSDTSDSDSDSSDSDSDSDSSDSDSDSSDSDQV